jgi:hypothetical protein
MKLEMEIQGADELMIGLLSATAGQQLKQRLWRKLRSWSFALERLIKIAMPVDTGRARASWGHWTKGDLEKPKRALSAGAGEDDAVWEIDEPNLTITQGSNVGYIARLNEGHSAKAPAGFIDKAFQTVREGLLADVSEEIDRWARR